MNSDGASCRLPIMFCVAAVAGHNLPACNPQLAPGASILPPLGDFTDLTIGIYGDITRY
jgi:hypothetical protein